MKPTTIYQKLILIRWICIGVLIYGQLSFFSHEAAAQEPTAVATPTPAPTWTPGPTPTDSSNVPVAPTPTTNPGATPSGRLVDFRVDNDEINSGECVQFSWVVRGDIDRVEFDINDDNKDPLLVSSLEDRQECPVEDLTYQLIVRWLDGTKTIRHRDINVHTGSSSGGEGSSGSSGTGSGSTSADGAGEFVVVTPILMTTGTPTPQSVAAAPAATADASLQQVTNAGNLASQPVVVPAGLLGSVHALPETGDQPGKSTSTEAQLMTVQAHPALWLMFGSGLVLLSSASAGLILLIRVLRQKPSI